VTLHDAGEALALGPARDVDALADLEGVGAELLADGVVGGVGRADLDDEAARRHAGLVEVAGERLGDLARVDGAVAELHRGVAVGVGVADLGHDVRASLDHGDGHETVRLVPHLGHAELGAQQTLLGLGGNGGHVVSLRA
jgi:hypothetical protein